MFYIYTKEKKPKIKFTVNLTRAEVKELMGDNLFLDYPDLDKNNFIIVEQENIFKHPILGSDGIIREMTRDELVASGIEVQLNQGEKIENGKIVEVEKPHNKIEELWNWTGTEWVYNHSAEKEKYFTEIDAIKAEILSYGFDYEIEGKKHRQKCRDKDITLLASNITFMMGEKAIFGKEEPITWYFEDNFGLKLDLQKSLILANYGKTFTQSVYDTEHYFKTKVEPKIVSEKEFEEKRQEIHNKLVGDKK